MTFWEKRLYQVLRIYQWKMAATALRSNAKHQPA